MCCAIKWEEKKVERYLRNAGATEVSSYVHISYTQKKYAIAQHQVTQRLNVNTVAIAIYAEIFEWLNFQMAKFLKNSAVSNFKKKTEQGSS